MKRLITSGLIITSMVLTPGIRADDDNSQYENPQAEVIMPAAPGSNAEDTTGKEPIAPDSNRNDAMKKTSPSTQPSPNEKTIIPPPAQVSAPEEDSLEGTPVGKGSDEGARAAKSKQWQNIAIAAGAVALAVTALILVASNDGHK